MKITDQEAMQLAIALGNLSQLSSLSLSLMPGYKLTDLSMESLGTNLAKLTGLTNVNLDFDSARLGEGNKKITATGIRLLMRGLAAQVNLTTLILSLQGVFGLPPTAYQYLAIVNPNITTYSLQLYSSRFSDSCFYYFASGVSKLSKLQELKLEIVTEQELALNGLLNLIYSLGQLSALQTLDIKLKVMGKSNHKFIDISQLKAAMEQLRDTLPSFQHFWLQILPVKDHYGNFYVLEVTRVKL
jgi:hypothetical protein